MHHLVNKQHESFYQMQQGVESDKYRLNQRGLAKGHSLGYNPETSGA
jgi:hypothetical protein